MCHPPYLQTFLFMVEYTIQSVTRSFRTALLAAGIKPCRFHDLRHTFATNLVLGGVDLVTVKELLGHADIAMTMRYAHPSPETKRKAVDALLVQKKWHISGI